jgi:predicted PolB exonuclease-like 3'-5' exonuclease
MEHLNDAKNYLIVDDHLRDTQWAGWKDFIDKFSKTIKVDMKNNKTIMKNNKSVDLRCRNCLQSGKTKVVRGEKFIYCSHYTDWKKADDICSNHEINSFKKDSGL